MHKGRQSWSKNISREVIKQDRLVHLWFDSQF